MQNLFVEQFVDCGINLSTWCNLTHLMYLKVRLNNGEKGISSSPFMSKRGLNNSISKIRALFFPKQPKIYAYILSSRFLVTNWTNIGHFLIWSSIFMLADREFHLYVHPKLYLFSCLIISIDLFKKKTTKKIIQQHAH